MCAVHHVQQIFLNGRGCIVSLQEVPGRTSSASCFRL